MVTLQIDDETFAGLKQKASKDNLSVEEWLKRRIADDVAPPVSNNQDAFQSWWSSFVGSARPTGFPLDDSRESIYD
jgi:hypothetical protein